ncbi:MGH1-like glycoside hydrolase domain-containing protein [Lacrimispora sp. 38-1]|uniref:MGH1-like glycoside hydrolase domain-containing protein n=1 Tax=Lacrimispora sp. 38-1 TaxID=3125778 RepID=UPI003CF0ECC5
MKIETSVSFQTSNELLQKLMDSAERKILNNLKMFENRLVLIEGGGYEKIWLETQPMGGEMYAKRNMEAALNNQLLFMEHQRPDGRLPGSIALIDNRITPQFDKFQGFCFPSSALNMYYLMGKDEEYLTLLYLTLEKFDSYLWRTRDSDGDGCLESWCKYDTGEDHALRYYDAPDSWSKETPPTDCKAVPMASLDIMSFSYSARETLSIISSIQGNENRKSQWKRKALAIQKAIKDYLWIESKDACFDRDKNHNIINVLFHNNLRAMYWNSFTRSMAERFVTKHLLNPDEFWTYMPLPSVAVNDPLFRNIKTNNWSGQCEALTYQRAIRALENYGYDYLIPQLGEKLFNAIGNSCVFVQQYDPFTGSPSLISLDGLQDSYGPAMLSVMEYTSRMYGVHLERNHIFWGTAGGYESNYEQIWGNHTFRIQNNENGSLAFIDGKKVFQSGKDLKIITDLTGNLLYIKQLSPDADIRNIKTYGISP